MLAVFNILVHDCGCYAGYNVQAGSMQYVTRQVRVGGNKGIQCRHTSVAPPPHCSAIDTIT